MSVVLQRFDTAKDPTTGPPHANPITYNHLTLPQAPVLRLENAHAFVAVVRNLWLTIEYYSFIALQYGGIESSLLVPGMGNLELHIPPGVVFKKCLEDKGIPDMVCRQLATELPVSILEVLLLCEGHVI